MPKPLAQEDPNVKIPAAARRAGARSEKIHAQVYETPKEAETLIVEPAAVVTPEVTPPAADLVAPPAPAPAPVPDESFEHKYKSMKGRFERAQETSNRLGDAVRTLQTELAQLRSAPPRLPAEQTFKKLLTADEEKEFGPEFLSVVGKKAQEALTPEVTALRDQVAQLQERIDGVGGRVVQDARARMEATLLEQVPNWLEQNNDPKFIQWLALPDIYSGDIRHNLLKAAYDRNDSRRVVAFFKGFLAEEAALVPAPSEPDPTPAAPAALPKIPLENLAAPGRAKTAAGNTPAEKPIITRAEIARFYADVNSNKYRGREKEKDAREREIFSAENEGRIR